jgi:hypothetical protein
MFKIIGLIVCLTLSGLVYANRSQIIIMPDGVQMICYYYNDGKIVYCEKL